MRIVLRGTMVHILLEDSKKISNIIQDIMTLPRKKYYLEIHLDEENRIINLIIFDIGLNFGKILEILEHAARKYKKLSEEKFNLLSTPLYQICQKIRKKRPLSPRNLFRLDIE